jgi:cobalt-precorrin 5A hydrolase
MVAGIGCRSGVSAEQVESALAAALTPVLPTGRSLTAIATPAAKGREPGIIAAAASRGVPLVLISQSELEATNPATLTHSEHSMAVMNVRSVAEAAALAGAGPKSRLLGPRIAIGPVTCALACLVAGARTDDNAPAVAREPGAGGTPTVGHTPAVSNAPADTTDTP